MDSFRNERVSPHPFVCPYCKGALAQARDDFRCERCGESYGILDGIYRFITQSKQREIAPFLRRYARIRRAEGRGSDDTRWYAQLPNIPTREWRIRRNSARAALRTLRKHFKKIRSRQLRVADLGAGNCWFTRLVAANDCDAYAIDIFDDEKDGLWAGRHYLRSADNPSGVAFARIVAHFDELPFPDEFYDAVIFNASLHYAADTVHTLREALRALKRDGVILVLDSPYYNDAAAGDAMLEEQEKYFARLAPAEANSGGSSYISRRQIGDWARRLNARVEKKFVFHGAREMARPLSRRIKGAREGASFPLVKITKP